MNSNLLLSEALQRIFDIGWLNNTSSVYIIQMIRTSSTHQMNYSWLAEYIAEPSKYLWRVKWLMCSKTLEEL